MPRQNTSYVYTTTEEFFKSKIRIRILKTYYTLEH